MKELRNLPRWAVIFSACVAAVALVFVILGVYNFVTGAGSDEVLMDILASAAFALAAWSIAVKGNPALSRRHEGVPNRRSPLRW